MQNLREKLLKAGLITESDATRAKETEKARPTPAPGRERRESGGGSSARPSSGPGPSRGHASGGPRGGGGRGPQRPAGQGAHGGSAGGGRSAPIPKLPPLAVPGNKEFQRLEAKKQLELDRRIRELVLANQVQPEAGEQTFYFVTRKNRLRRMELSTVQAAALEQGQLAVVERPDPGQIEHSLVPAAIAEEIHKLQPKSVRFFNRENEPVGFLSDDELTRRQKFEADRQSRGEGDDESGTSVENAEPQVASSTATEDGTSPPDIRVPTVTLPEDSENGGETPDQAPNEQLAEKAERASAEMPPDDEHHG